MHPDWIVPDWPVRARAICTTRAGGVSVGAYATLNLGEHVGDDPARVAANWLALAENLQVRPVFLNQVHGVKTVCLDADSPHGLSADACVTEQFGVACTVRVADCLPVLLSDRAGRRVAAAHAGWRGLAGLRGWGVLESVLAQFGSPSAQLPGGIAPADTWVWLGPCIGPSAFEVGAEVSAAFAASGFECAGFFRPQAGQKFLADLPGLARQRLQALGVRHIYGNDGSPAWCTVGQSSRFFSHRRDRVSGRMAACIWRP